MVARYSDEFKNEAVKLALENNKSQSQIARELGIPQVTLSRWVIKYHGNDGSNTIDTRTPTETNFKLESLRKEIKELQEENDVLRKA